MSWKEVLYHFLIDRAFSPLTREVFKDIVERVEAGDYTLSARWFYFVLDLDGVREYAW